ncbi:MAG: GAF domain-containing sensor histidine kinase [Anaerolineaceae bacterium]|nr:MAG: GAF domain-containing sensor histidine kinase [Anaerolineaceae bacterium]
MVENGAVTFIYWLGGLLLLLLAGITLFFLVQRVRRLEKNTRQLTGQVASQTKELAALQAISGVVSNELGLPETLDIALQKTLEVVGVNAGAIFLLDEEPASAAITTHQGLNAACIEALDHLQVTGSFLESVIEAGDSKTVSNLTIDQTFEVLYACGFRRLAISPLLSRGIVLGAIFVTTREQKIFSEQDIALLTSIGGQIGLAIEGSRLFEAEQHRTEQFRLISAVGRRFSSILDIDKVLAHVVRLIQQTFGYYHVAIGLIEGDEVVYRMGAGPLWDDPAFDFMPARLKVGQEGVSGWVAGTGQPMLVPDVSREPRYVLMHGSRCRSELIVPVIAKGRVIGVLDIQSDHLNDFDDTDLAVIQALGNQAAIAIENARLYEQAQQLAVMEERARLARDLHDAVTQSIYSLTLLAAAGLRMIDNGDSQQIRDNQIRIDDIAQQALQEMRLLVFELRPSELKELGLIGALERRLEVVERRAGIEARLQADESMSLPYDLEEELYRIAQEALNNALKHARASAVFVRIQLQDRTVNMTIHDDGRGFEPLAIGDKGGLGLQNMQERADKINADITVSAAPGAGTIVSVSATVKGNNYQ